MIFQTNRTHEMIQILTSKANRDNDDISGFGRRWDDGYYYPTSTGGFGGSWRFNGDVEHRFGGINQGKSMSVSFKPMSGILMQNKYLPLMWGGFTMDLN